MMNDEIVDEVRAIPEAHAAEFNFDLRAIYNDLKKSESEHIATGHPFINLPTSFSMPNSTQRSSGLASLAGELCFGPKWQ